MDLPKGFVAVNPEAVGAEGDDAGPDHRLQFVADGEPRPFKGWVWRGSDEGPPWRAEVFVVSLPRMRKPTKSFFLDAVRTVEPGGRELPDDTGPDSVSNWHNWHGELRDARGRRVVEWAYLEKGCERAERYERVVEIETSLVQIVLVVDGTIDDALLADWTARFFDAPLGLPIYEARRSLAAVTRSPR